MLPQLPRNTLLTADAGFVGYEFWKSLLDADLHFLIRVGSNVKLIRKLGYGRQNEHTVYLWPSREMKRHQPPLVLRLIVLHDGRKPVYLVTNVPQSKLSDRQAAKVYQARWGVELFFRTFKQTFGRCKLRSRTPEYVELEFEWALLALWGMLLLGQMQIHADGQTTGRQSPAKTIHAFQKAIVDFRIRPGSDQYGLWLGLRTAVLDDYQRTGPKASRDYPRKKQRERTGPPKITLATKEQQLAIEELKRIEEESRLAA
jgi:hypothetical protein